MRVAWLSLLQNMTACCFPFASTLRDDFTWLTMKDRELEEGSTILFPQQTSQKIGNPLEELLDGKLDSVEYSGGQVICNAPRRNRVYLPGSFNPLHNGHR